MAGMQGERGSGWTWGSDFGRDRDRQLLKFCHLENGAVWFVLQTGLSVMNESKIPSIVRSAEYTVGVENCE